MPSDDRDLRRVTFNTEAERYDRYRPHYPDQSFADIAELSGMKPPAKVLEIGSGTGHATLPLARRGYQIHGIELGEKLVAVAQRKLAGYPVTFEVGAFEQSQPSRAHYDLVLSASAFHWLDREAAYSKIDQALKPVGAIALLWNLHDREAEAADFSDAMRECYQRHAPELANRRNRAGPTSIIASTGVELQRFGPVQIREHRFTVRYDADSLIGLLGTYSDHIALPRSVQDALYPSIRDVIQTRFAGSAERAYRCLVQVARRG